MMMMVMMKMPAFENLEHSERQNIEQSITISILYEFVTPSGSHGGVFEILKSSRFMVY